MIKILHRVKATTKDRIVFLRQLALILRSGLPILEAMELLRLQLRGRMALSCYHVQRLLQHGSSLAEAMSKEKVLFTPLMVQLVSAGELSGQLSPVLEELAKYYEQQDKLRNYLLKSALYPLFLLAAALGVLIFFFLYILPILAGVYANMHMRPSGIMLTLLNFQAWLSTHVMLVGALLAGLALAVRFYGRSFCLWLLNKNWCGNFYSSIYEIRFCKLLALLLDSGLSITLAMQSIAASMTGSSYERQLLLLKSRLERGVDIATALSGVKGLLSPLSLSLVGVGVATGCLPAMLREAARLGEESLASKLMRFKELVTPLLLLVVAGIIAVVVCSVLGPLMEMIALLPE